MPFNFSNAIYDSEHWFHNSIPSRDPQFVKPHTIPNTMHLAACFNCSFGPHNNPARKVPFYIWREAQWLTQSHTPCMEQSRMWPRSPGYRIQAPCHFASLEHWLMYCDSARTQGLDGMEMQWMYQIEHPNSHQERWKTCCLRPHSLHITPINQHRKALR